MAESQKPLESQGENQIVNLPTSHLRVPPRELMPRVIGGINPTVVERYAELLLDGFYDDFFPLHVWKRGEDEYILVSGIHRYEACIRAGIEEVPCVVRTDITEKNFLMEAFVANLRHGYSYEPGEREEVVRKLYSQGGYSVKEIHERTRLPKRTLQRWVKDLAEERRKQRDAAILEMAATGMSCEEIGRRVGMTKQGVAKVLKGQQNATWRFVDPQGKSSDFNRFTLLKCCEELIDAGLCEEESNSQKETLAQDGCEEKSHKTEQTIFTGAEKETRGTSRSCDAQEECDLEIEPPTSALDESRDLDPSIFEQLDMFKHLPFECQQAVQVLYYVSQNKKLDLDDIADRLPHQQQLGRSWLQSVVNCGIILSLGTAGGVEEIAERLCLEPEVVKTMGNFVTMDICNPLGPGMWEWARDNLWKAPPGWLRELTGVKAEDLKYLLDGKNPPVRRAIKPINPEMVEFFEATVRTLRNLRDSLRMNVFTQEALLVYLLCSNKLTVVINEIKDAIRKQEPIAKPGENGDSPIALDPELLEQFKPLVGKVASMNAKKIPGLSKEELEQDLWIAAILGIIGWDPGRGNLAPWVQRMVFWKLKEIQKQEYDRLKHETQHRADTREPSIGENK